MNISAFHYELLPLASLGSLSHPGVRRGALLKVDLGPSGIGYVDCHPWPEMGHLPLDEQLELLARGELTEVTRRSLCLAKRDAELRLRGVSAFANAEMPESHALVADARELARADLSFPRIKVKVGRELSAELESIRALLLDPGFSGKLRLDFNGTQTAEGAARFLDQLGGLLSRIDFIEDPCPFDSRSWRGLRANFGVRLALDRVADLSKVAAEPDSADVLVVKPAFQNPEEGASLARSLGWKLVVTTALDHPLGQVAAAWEASRLLRLGILEPCGLSSHTAYEPNEFSRELRISESRLVPPQGTGFGFDRILASLCWVPVGAPVFRECRPIPVRGMAL